MKRMLCLLSLFCLATPIVHAGQQGPIIAIFDIQDKGSGIDAQTRDNLVDFLSARLAKAGYRVIPRAQVRKRLRAEQKETYKECYDQTCQIDLGRELAAQKTLALKILKIGSTCQITAELYDLRQAATDLATTAQAKCQDDQSVLEAFTRVAEDLNRPLLGSQRKLDEGLAEMSRLTVSEDGTREERAGRAWKVAQEISKDSMIAKEGKVRAIRKYLEDFGSVAPTVSAQAQNLLVEIDLATLVIMSSPPGAKVFINDKQAGIAPFTRELKAGDYKLTAALDAHSDFSEEVKLDPGQKRELSIMLKKIVPATLVVNSTPGGAWVDVDGKTAGQVPVAKELPPGEHQVTVKLDDHLIKNQKITLAANEQKTLNLNLESTPIRPKILWGHVTFWSGVGLAALGGISFSQALSARDDFDATGDSSAESRVQTWTGVMYTGFGVGGALMITGAVLWILAPDEASWAKEKGGYIGASSDGSSMFLTAGGRW